MPALRQIAKRFWSDLAGVYSFAGPVLPLLVAAIAMRLVARHSPKHASKEFYSAAADIGVVLLVAIALEARLLRVQGLPKLTITDKSRWFAMSDEAATTLWKVLAVALVVIVAVVLIQTEEDILRTLASSSYAKADAPATFRGLTFGLVAVATAGVMLPGER